MQVVDHEHVKRNVHVSSSTYIHPIVDNIYGHVSDEGRGA